MSPHAVLSALWADRLPVRLAPDGQNLSVPAGRLTPEQRAMLREHKAELVAFLHAAHVTAAALIEAAMRACDQYGDSEADREKMRLDCLATPPHLRQDLLDHFRQTYPAKGAP